MNLYIKRNTIKKSEKLEIYEKRLLKMLSYKQKSHIKIK